MKQDGEGGEGKGEAVCSGLSFVINIQLIDAVIISSIIHRIIQPQKKK